MATESHPPFINLKLHSLISLVSLLMIIVLSFSLMNCYALDTTHETIDVSSLLSTSTCQPSVQDVTSKGASLKVTHMYGPCSKFNTKVPSPTEVLTLDEMRVASIQNRHAESDKLGTSKATIPATSGISLGTGKYVVTVGLGTPVKYLTFVFDTVSTLAWTQCKPCTKSCYKQNGPIFDSLASSTYRNVSCERAECSRLTDVGYGRDCSASTCVYFTRDVDEYYSTGFLANEKLTLTPHDVVDEFPFGCGRNNRPTFGNADGILGLGRGTLSVLGQTGYYFSYCLPTKSGSKGHLTLGKERTTTPTKLAFTPFETNPQRVAASSYYYVKIEAISVGGRQLPISPSVYNSTGKIVMDSGTVITRLPPTIYTALRAAFRKQMSMYPLAPAVSVLDTCYDFTNHTKVTIPSILITFAGNVKVKLGVGGTLFSVSRSHFCLAFAGNKADKDTGIYGNVQQQTFEVVYDVAGGRLGFGPGGCS